MNSLSFHLICDEYLKLNVAFRFILNIREIVYILYKAFKKIKVDKITRQFNSKKSKKYNN